MMLLFGIGIGACGGQSSAEDADAGIHADAGAHAGSGGNAGMGGAGGAGGSGGTSSGDAAQASCSGQVTFHLMAPSGHAAEYCNHLPCAFATGLTILDGAGQGLTLTEDCGMTDCDRCAASFCSGACPAAQPLTESGEEFTWNGVVWVADGTCGAGTACTQRHCATPGRYTAHLCAYPNQQPDAAFSCGSVSQNPVCVDVPFDYPTNDTVTGTLAPGN